MPKSSLTHPFDPIFVTDLDLIYQNALHRQDMLLHFLNTHPKLVKEHPMLKTKVMHVSQSLNHYYEPFIRLETSQMPFRHYQMYHVNAVGFSSKDAFLLSVKQDMTHQYHSLGKNIESSYKTQQHHEFLDPSLIFKRQTYEQEQEHEPCYYKEYHALIKPLTKSLSDHDDCLLDSITKDVIKH